MPRTASPLQNKASIQAALFDLDGTLIDTLEAIRASMRHATKTVLGKTLPDEVLMRHVGTPLAAQMKVFDAEQTDGLMSAYREHHLRVHDSLIKEYPGTAAALEQLKGIGYRLGVVTSKGRTLAERGLLRCGLTRFVEVLVALDDVSAYKPDPYPLRYAAERLGVDVTRCAYIGDSPHDMCAATAAGCVSIAALWGVATPERLLALSPQYAIRSVSEVAQVLRDHDALPAQVQVI